MRYIISDIHGCLNEFEELLEKIRLSQEDHLYVLGDAVDRGTDPIGVLQKLMKMDNMTYILGNHDVSLYYAIKRFGLGLRDLKREEDKKAMQLWIEDGAMPTMISFITLPQEEKIKIIQFIENASVYEELVHNGEKYVLVHAGISGFDESRSLEDYKPEDFIYGRADYNGRYYKREKTHLITGHTPTPFIRDDRKPLIYQGKGHIAIDCGCVFGGQLAAYCIETGKCIYVAKK